MIFFMSRKHFSKTAPASFFFRITTMKKSRYVIIAAAISQECVMNVWTKCSLFVSEVISKILNSNGDSLKPGSTFQFVCHFDEWSSVRENTMTIKLIVSLYLLTAQPPPNSYITSLTPPLQHISPTTVNKLSNCSICLKYLFKLL
jgi:hypothetical protein